MSSSDSSEELDRWHSIFAAVTDSELRLYESAPWSGEAWRAPAEAYSLITTRLVGSVRRTELPEFSIRCATADGVITHSLRAETHRDLAGWAKALVNGSHASAVTQRELVCSKWMSYAELGGVTCELNTINAAPEDGALSCRRIPE